MIARFSRFLWNVTLPSVLIGSFDFYFVCLFFGVFFVMLTRETRQIVAPCVTKMEFQISAWNSRNSSATCCSEQCGCCWWIGPQAAYGPASFVVLWQLLLVCVCCFLWTESIDDIRQAQSSGAAVDMLIESLRKKNDPGWFQRFKEALKAYGKWLKNAYETSLWNYYLGTGISSHELLPSHVIIIFSYSETIRSNLAQIRFVLLSFCRAFPHH